MTTLSPGRRWPGALPATLLLSALLALTACHSGSDTTAQSLDSAAVPEREQDSGNGAARQDNGTGRGAEEAPEGAGAAAQAHSPELAGTHLIRTALLTVVTPDVAGGYTQALALTETADGYVEAEETAQDDGGQRTQLSLRVPQEGYEELLAELSELGELRSRDVRSEDVTDQVVDVESRIATQEESVRRVRALMEDAASLSDVVTLESELSERTERLEALKSQQASLRERTGMAAISLTLREPGAAEDVGPSVGDGLAGGWSALVTTGRWIVTALGAMLPFAAALTLLGWFGWLARRRVRGWRAQRDAPPAPSAPPAEETGSAAEGTP